MPFPTIGIDDTSPTWRMSFIKALITSHHDQAGRRSAALAHAHLVAHVMTIRRRFN